MKCSSFEKKLKRFGIAFKDKEMLEHIKNCPDCSLQVEKVRQIQRIVGLKRYEKPGPDVLMQCLAAVREEIVSSGLASEGSMGALKWAEHVMPVVRYSVAGMLFMLIGFHAYFASTSIPVVQSQLPEPMMQNRSALAGAPPDLRYLTSPALFSQDGFSNAMPGAVHYGVSRSRPVSFSY